MLSNIDNICAVEPQSLNDFKNLYEIELQLMDYFFADKNHHEYDFSVYHSKMNQVIPYTSESELFRNQLLWTFNKRTIEYMKNVLNDSAMAERYVQEFYDEGWTDSDIFGEDFKQTKR